MSQFGILGETTSYPTTYSPETLYPIARSNGRDAIVSNTITDADKMKHSLSIGIDWWHCFELSWLNSMGISQVAMARLSIPADSQFIVESKSLKLYLNSFNFTEFTSVDEVKETIEIDLSKLLQTTVIVDIFPVEDIQSLAISHISGTCIDQALDNHQEKIPLHDDVQSDMLALSIPKQDSNNLPILQSYHSHLLRSNCPVTNQPDWGSVQIDIHCHKIDEASLLSYLLTFRKHNGFHEQCVEQIFADLTTIFQPSQLMVRAWYTRRGGIDINPCRVSDIALLPSPSRLVRQ